MARARHRTRTLEAFRGSGAARDREDHPQNATNYAQSGAAESQSWLVRALGDSGYQPVRYLYEMLYEDLEHLPNAELPQGIETRPAKPEQYHQIWQALVEAFSEHWGDAVSDESDYERFINDPRLKPDTVAGGMGWGPGCWNGSELCG